MHWRYFNERFYLIISCVIGVISIFLSIISEYFFGVTGCILCHIERFLWLVGTFLSAGLVLCIRDCINIKWKKPLYIAGSMMWCVGVCVGLYHFSIQKEWIHSPAFCKLKPTTTFFHSKNDQNSDVEVDLMVHQLLKHRPSSACAQITASIMGVPFSLLSAMGSGLCLVLFICYARHNRRFRCKNTF